MSSPFFFHLLIVVPFCASTHYYDSSTLTERSFPPLSEIDGNQFADEFNIPFCDGFFDLWEDPSIPNSQRNNIGRAIYQTTSKLKQAKRLIRTGKIIDIGYNYIDDLTFAQESTYNINTICNQTGGSIRQPINWDFCFTEVRTAGVGNTGTQLDGMGHIYMIGENNELTFFNNFKGSDVIQPPTIKYLGIEHLPFFFTRAILLDVPAFFGVDVLAEAYAVTTEDILGTLEYQGMDLYDLELGDVVLVYTGWDEQFYFQNEPRILYDFARAPGVAPEVFRDVFYDAGIMIVGADTIVVEIPLFNGLFVSNHPFWMDCAGGFLHENVKLDEWVQEVRQGNLPYIGAYLFQPLPVTGSAGGGGKPVVMF